MPRRPNSSSGRATRKLLPRSGPRLALDGEPTADKLASLGEGWVAEEALAMSIYCTLVAEDFRRGVTLAVNHGGDSDSTGAITGNILGVMSPHSELPREWLAPPPALGPNGEAAARPPAGPR